MSLTARVVRQFYVESKCVTLQRVLPLPAMPTMGSRLDLRAQGVEAPLEVIGVTVRPLPSGTGFRPPDLDVFLAYEPLEADTLAREGGWRDSESA